MSKIIKGYQSEGIKTISTKSIWSNDINKGELLDNSSPLLSQSEKFDMNDNKKHESQQIGYNLIEQAKKEAEDILEQARIDAQNLMEEAIQLGSRIEEECMRQKEEMQEEHDELIRVAEETSVEILKKASIEKEEIIKEAYKEKQQILESVELDTAKTISKIIEHIVGNEIYENINWIRCFIKKVLRNENILEDVKLIVSERNYKKLEGAMIERIGQRNIIVDMDMDIADDVCIVETSNGTIEYNISTTLEQVLSEIMMYQEI